VQIWSGIVTIDEFREFINNFSQFSLFTGKNLQSLSPSSKFLYCKFWFGFLENFSKHFFYIRATNFHLSKGLALHSGLGAGDLPGELLPLGEEVILRSGRGIGHLSSRTVLLHNCHPRLAIFFPFNSFILLAFFRTIIQLVTVL